MITRRRLLWSAALSQLAFPVQSVSATAILDPNRLNKWVERLPVPQRAVSVGSKPNPLRGDPDIPLFRLTMREFAFRFHRDLPEAPVWGFDASSPGPIIEAYSGRPLLIEWVNALPVKHLFTVDRSIHGTEDKPDVRTIVHVHGARVPAAGDGYPENWYTQGNSVINLYPNLQDAATLWYHDHAMGITRLNLYAGLMGFYLIRDHAEDALKVPAGKYEIPLMLYDRTLTSDGRLFYPVSASANQPWVAEFSGEAILANGKLFPFLEVEPRAYRLRLANGSNSRFLYLRFSTGESFRQIGSDQGLLKSPVTIASLTLAPGERADLIMDFAQASGRNIVLASDSHEIMQFRVSRHASPGEAFILPSELRTIPPPNERESVRTREMTLDGPDDADDSLGMRMPMTLNGSGWHDPITEKPTLNSVETWTLINLTDDSHPIHLHLVRFRILDRRAFDLFTYRTEKLLRYTAEAIPPELNESGWKDTVRAEPGMATRILVRFEGYVGRYVWHCHIAEHEDNEMMRPYEVVPE